MINEEVAVINQEPIDNKSSKENDQLKKVTDSIKFLSDNLNEMNNLFQEKIKHSEFQERIVDKMHAELQKYKEDMYAQLVRPILLDIIEVRDSIVRNSQIYSDKQEGEKNIPNELFRSYSDDIQDILERNQVNVYRSEVGEKFVPVKQRAIKKVNTEDNELHGKIYESMSSGYEYNGRVISAEKVSVYCFKKPEAKQEEEI